MSTDEDLIAEAHSALLPIRIKAGGGPSVADTIERLADSLSASLAREAELREQIAEDQSNWEMQDQLIEALKRQVGALEAYIQSLRNQAANFRKDI